MDYIILIVTLTILTETTYVLIRKFKPYRANTRKIYVDTSVLIDGRIVNIAKTGFLSGDLLIPKGVLVELQLLADGKDNEKRTRARAGLENIAELERIPGVYTDIVKGNKNNKVDEELLWLAKENKGVILTVDYNLIKVAEASKIEVLNINDLSLAVRTEFLPGEKATIKITNKGSSDKQGVGHLEDDTMVIVENASSKVGKEVAVEFVRFYETSSGMMIFAKLA
ncbi:TRAM domain-containing protein [Candidatus Saccharibacteria bacterium]|nr:TRAM domain-containing protein [Candidatus Saccharibacteria bacterium]